MKKLLLIIAIVALSLGANAQSTVKYPFGSADYPSVTVTSKVTAQTFTVTNNLTYVDLGTVDTNKTITVTIGKSNIYSKTIYPDKGAILLIKVTSDATARTMTFSTGLIGLTLALTASKASVISFIYDGSNFIETAAQRITN